MCANYLAEEEEVLCWNCILISNMSTEQSVLTCAMQTHCAQRLYLHIYHVDII